MNHVLCTVHIFKIEAEIRNLSVAGFCVSGSQNAATEVP